MASATNSTPATVIPFPSRHGQNDHTSGLGHRAIDEWNRTRNTALAVCAFRGMNDGDADATVREMIVEGGAEAVAFMLEEAGRAIKSMQHIVDELTAVDALIASAADRVLSEAGL